MVFAEVLDVPISAFFEPPPGVKTVTFPSGRTMPARHLLAGLMTQETQDRLGGLYEAEAYIDQAADIRMVAGAARERLESLHRDLQDIDTLAEGIASVPPQKTRSKRTKSGGRKKR